MAKRTGTIEVRDMKTVNEWNGFTTGDPIKVLGERGEFTFRWAQMDDDGETVKSVCVIGGAKGHNAFRHFYPDRLKPIPRRRTRRSKSSNEEE